MMGPARATLARRKLDPLSQQKQKKRAPPRRREASPAPLGSAMQARSLELQRMRARTAEARLSAAARGRRASAVRRAATAGGAALPLAAQGPRLRPAPPPELPPPALPPPEPDAPGAAEPEEPDAPAAEPDAPEPEEPEEPAAPRRPRRGSGPASGATSTMRVALLLAAAAALRPPAQLRVATFNLLAPVHKSGVGATREADDDASWLARGARLADFVAETLGSSDALCLQEWFFEPRWGKMFEEALPRHALVTSRRRGVHPHSGEARSDGVAMLVKGKLVGEHDADGEGRLQAGEFRGIMIEGVRDADTAEDYDLLWAEFDRDGAGYVDVAALKTFFSELGEDVEKIDVEKMITEAKQGRDAGTAAERRVSKEELRSPGPAI
ncbi:Ca2-binding protein [Aureococcus anophagefferens]|nr:Ca2-binding protein [Aureococcus anophagefferens]